MHTPAHVHIRTHALLARMLVLCLVVSGVAISWAICRLPISSTYTPLLLSYVGGFFFIALLALIAQRSYRNASLRIAKEIHTALQIKNQEVIDLKDEMLSIMSHQLKTPVSAIQWQNEILLDGTLGKLTQKQRTTIEAISAQTNHLKEMIDSLLNIARLESGRVAIQPEEISVRALVDVAMADVATAIGAKHQEVEISIHEDTPTVQVDPSLVHHIFMNLLTNASKYSQEQSTIHIRALLDGDAIRVEIEDEGYGIPKAEQAHLFDKYFRATNATKKIKDGTGLGLYLCKMIVTLAGGDIGFTSVEKKGTTFWFTLPLTGMKAQHGEVTLSS